MADLSSLDDTEHYLKTRIRSHDNQKDHYFGHLSAFMTAYNDFSVLLSLSSFLSCGPSLSLASSFLRLHVDTSCWNASNGSLNQCKAYCEHTGTRYCIDKTNQTECQFGVV